MDLDHWLAICGVGTLLLRVGMTLHEAGMVRSKNSAGIAIRKLADGALAVLIFGLVGSIPVFSSTHGMNPANYPGGAMFFLTCCVLVSTAIVGGVTAERIRFWPALAGTVALAGVIIPPLLRWTRMDGWLMRMGFHDFAAAGSIHLAGGLCAAVAAIAVGPRMGKYNRDGSTTAIPGHSMPFASIGTSLMTVGWLAYVMGFAWRVPAGQIALNVLWAAAAGALAALVFGQLRFGKPDIHLTYSGLLGALVAISAGADAPAWAAVVIGAGAGLLVPIVTLWIDLICRIDDPTGGIAVHAAGSAWGLLAAGLFATRGGFVERAKSFGVQVGGVAVIAVLTLAISAVVFFGLKAVCGLRAKEADEFDGLDLAEHDVGAYPDFQHISIR